MSSFPLPTRTSDQSKRAYKKNDEEAATKESDPLLQGNAQTTFNSSENQGILRTLNFTPETATQTQTRAGFSRRSSKSPVQQQSNQLHFSAAQPQQQQQSDTNNPENSDIPMKRVTSGDMEAHPHYNSDAGEHDGYEAVEDATVHSRSQHSAAMEADGASSQSQNSSTHLYSQQSGGSSRSSRSSRGGGSASGHEHAAHNTPGGGGGTYREAASVDDRSLGSGELPPLLEIPEEIYAVRKAALQVLKPLTKTWVSFRSQMFKYCSSVLAHYTVQ
jgi:hypothetical protein